MSPTLQGVFPVVATTFDETGGLDLWSQASLVNYLLSQGAHGIALFGNAGEGYAVSPEEWTTLLNLVIKEVHGCAPVVVSTGHTGMDVAIQLSKRAEDAGASALMILPPYYLRPGPDGVVYYYEQIGRAVKIPIIVQDAPLLTQVSMPADLLGRMAHEIEGVQYVKIEAPPTAPKTSAVLSAADGGLTAFGGLNGQFMIEEIGRGARGTMPGSDMTSGYAAIWNRLERGDQPGAWEIFTHMLPLIRFELQPGMGVSAMKHNLHQKEVIRSVAVRHPTTALDAESLRELEFLRDRVEKSLGELSIRPQ